MAVWRWHVDMMCWILVAGESDGVLPDQVPFLGKYWCIIGDSKITYLRGLPIE